MELRLEEAADGAAVRDVQVRAFGDHGPAVAELADALRELTRPGCGASIVAELDGRVVGHVMCTPSLLDAPQRLVEVQVLSPLGVVPEHQGCGVGSALVRAAVQAMDEQAVPALFLEGSPDYYPRFGFRPGGELGFRKPSLRIPDVAFQALRLPAYQPWMTGTLVYAQEFWAHDCVGLREPASSDDV